MTKGHDRLFVPSNGNTMICRGHFAQVPNGGLVVLPERTTIANCDLVVALTARHRLPAVYAFDFLVSAGGLMSYDTDVIEHTRRAASYVDRILRGDKPAESSGAGTDTVRDLGQHQDDESARSRSRVDLFVQASSPK